MAQSKNIPVAAIDVGYFATKFTTGRDSKGEINTGKIPSICPIIFQEALPTTGMSALSGVTIKVKDQMFFVGPDAALRSSGRDARTVNENFARTDTYRALFLGALHYMCREFCKDSPETTSIEIKRLVVGLPLNTLLSERSALREWVEGGHNIGEMPWGKTPVKVTIRSCTVVAQPQGALLSYAAQRQTGNSSEENSLVLDMGGGTFDWFLTHGKKALYERCGAYPKGMLACAFAICDQIKSTLRDDITVVNRVDVALREGRETVLIGGSHVEMAPYMPRAKAILEEALMRMIESIKSFDSVDVILFTGGGAKLLSEQMAGMYPDRKATMHVDGDPVFSNVRGFHLLGEVLSHG